MRRSRFAFGKIIALQARANTANQLRKEFEDSLQNEEEPPEETDEYEVPPEEVEEFDEDFFQNGEEPSKDDCA